MTTLRALSAAALAAGLSVATPASAQTKDGNGFIDATTVPRNQITTEVCLDGLMGFALEMNNFNAMVGHRLRSLVEPKRIFRVAKAPGADEYVFSCKGQVEEEAFFDHELAPSVK